METSVSKRALATDIRGAVVSAAPAVTAWALRAAAMLAAGAVSVSVMLSLGASMLGYDSFVITGGSMAPAVREGALLIAKRVDPASIVAGDVITFRRSEAPSVAVTHRVVAVGAEGDPLTFQTKGDANLTPDPEPLIPSGPVSRMILAVPFAGTVLGLLRTLPGQIALIAFPAIMLAAGAARGVLRDHAAPKTAPIPSIEEARRRRVSLPRPTLPMPDLDGVLSALPAIRPRAVVTPIAEAPTEPAAQIVDSAPAASMPTARMERVLAMIEAHRQLGLDLGESIAEAMRPIAELRARHEASVQQFESQLDARLRPIVDYAETLEANLDRLVGQLQAEGSRPSTALAVQLERDRERAAEVRAAVARTRAPLESLLSREAEAIDALLAGFDGDLDSVESRLATQRRDLLRLASRLQSGNLEAAVTFLQSRAENIRGLAERGFTEAEEIGAMLAISAERAQDGAHTSSYLTHVLEALGAGQAAPASGGESEAPAIIDAAAEPAPKPVRRRKKAA